MLDILMQLLRDFYTFAAYISNGNSFPEPLSEAEEKNCLERSAEGDEEARSALIEHNLRLVAHIAKKYTYAGRESDDIISIGTIGLIKAVSTYDRHKGTALATYAARCIENEILMSIRSEKRQASEVSLYDPMGTDKDGNDILLSEVLGSDSSAVCDEVIMRINAEQLRKLVIKHLSDRERIVVELRYGLAGRFCMTQREIAQILGISRSYVSRIEKKALGKLCKAFELQE